ncbi:MAG: tyrosine-protein phosphatase [Bdellovibrionaceae bacterium]|nr:tyrosine-protein phosphatase [Bdellovibrio sp.]
MLSFEPVLKFNFMALVILIGFTKPEFAFAADDLPALHVVTPSIMRGGRPSEAGLKILIKKKIRTIIDLEDSNSAIQAEKKFLANTNIRHISIPINSLRTPKDADVKKIQDLLNDSANFPIYIHCQHGEDRTGLMVGLYRWEHGMAAADAYREMLALGFHRLLFNLDRYYKNKTHL